MACDDSLARSRSAEASPLDGIDGHWCRALARPAFGNGCRLFRGRDGDRCPGRCAMPGGNGMLCLESGSLLPAGPCREGCERRSGAGRRRRA
ncbi:MAG: hypothetical protein ABFC89_01675 [Methanospirillum sp.]